MAPLRDFRYYLPLGRSELFFCNSGCGFIGVTDLFGAEGIEYFILFRQAVCSLLN